MLTSKKNVWRTCRDAAISLIPLLLGALSLAFSLLSAQAYAASLGEAELRSWLGEPLEIRIPISTNVTREEIINKNCFSVASDSQPTGLSRDLRVTLLESSTKPVFLLRGNAGFNEPFLQIIVRYACANQSGQGAPDSQGAISRQYTLLVDPRPNIEPPALANAIPATVSPLSVTSNNTPDPQRLRDQWISAGATNNQSRDSLDAIAEGVFPKSIKRKARYIAALRTLNPALAGINDKAPLPPNMALMLPDLKTLANTRAVVAATPERNRRFIAPNDTASVNTKPKQTSNVSPRKNRPATTPFAAPAAALVTTTPPPRASPRQTDTSFTLKLSGAGVDTSRSDNVTDEQRAVLREKQFLLDADDQIAQFLSLKNSVKQLESRLNQVQSRLDAEAASSNAGTPLNLSSSPATQSTPPQPAPALAPTPTSTPVSKSAQQTTQQQPSTTSGWFSRVPVLNMPSGSTIFTSVLIIILIAMAIWIGRSLTRRRSKKSAEKVDAIEAEIAQLSAIEDAKKEVISPSSDEAVRASSANVSLQAAAQNAADDFALAQRRSKSGVKTLSASATQSLQTKQGFDPAATFKLDAPGDSVKNTDNSDINLFDDNTDGPSIQFDLDNSPSTTVDFLLDDGAEASNIVAAARATNTDAVSQTASDEKLQKSEAPFKTEATIEATTEARMRRLQYMNERYPELMSNTTSIDDADSVINTARHYLTETENGAARATELLGYALEERPQEIRFWLAQFETFRAKSQTAEFIDLAQKFSILFGQSVEWRHVRQVGHALAPKNALFSLPPGVSPSAKFDSSIWLIVDPEKSKLAESRAVALRAALMDDEHARGVNKGNDSATPMKGASL